MFTFFSPFIFPDQAINNSASDDELDISALDAFCHIVKNEHDLSAQAARLLAAKIQSLNTKESLFALDALEGNLNQRLFYFVKVIELINYSFFRMYGYARLQLPG